MSSSSITHPLVDQLRQALADRHLSQREAAEQLGVSPRTLLYWLSIGATPQPRHRRAIIAWLDGAEAEREEVEA